MQMKQWILLCKGSALIITSGWICVCVCVSLCCRRDDEQGLQKSDRDLPIAPGVLMAPAAEEGGGAALGIEDMPDDMQVKRERRKQNTIIIYIYVYRYRAVYSVIIV